MECLDVRLVVHQTHGADVFSLSYEVKHPHTNELLATMTDPSHHYAAGITLARQVSAEIYAVVLALTDPEPF